MKPKHSPTSSRGREPRALGTQLGQGIVVVAPQEPVLDAMRSVSITVPSITLHGAQEPGGHEA